jgi:hypothetical protein
MTTATLAPSSLVEALMFSLRRGVDELTPRFSRARHRKRGDSPAKSDGRPTSN